MEYNFLINKKNETDNEILPESKTINKFLLKNNISEVSKALAFFNSDEKFLYLHGFLGTGKRQFINYIEESFNEEVIKLEYYCKNATVCDDILIYFINILEQQSLAKAVNINAKITTLSVKFQQYISSIKKPFVLILHSFDDILDENRNLVVEFLRKILEQQNIKIVVSTRAMNPDMFSDLKVDRKVFLKAFTKDIFKEFINSYQVECTETILNDFYKYTRGYYYYTALSLQIVSSLNMSLCEFLEKYAKSEMSFDSYLGMTYVSMIPITIRNFFWFLRTVRHGISLNALAVLGLLDEFSVEYLKKNLMIFQVEEMLYVQDYFQQNIDISIPSKTEIRLHKYLISIYEKQLKQSIQNREIMLSRQALRAEITFHTEKIEEIENGKKIKNETERKEPVSKQEEVVQIDPTLDEKIKTAQKMMEQKKYKEAIEIYTEVINAPDVHSQTLIDGKITLARLYKEIGDYSTAQKYYELVERIYIKNNEVINLNYLYYELTELYFLLYKNDRAIETVKKVIYSVDTPQSLMVSACTLLGNIYLSLKKYEEAFSYYQKALESLDDNTDSKIKSELYFKYALAKDDNNNEKEAFEYYSKCVSISSNNPYKPLAYSNMGACYFDNENYSDAEDCFVKAYEEEKTNNNYDGIYYNAFYLAKIYLKEQNQKALDFLIEAKQSAEFINQEDALLEVTLALGDYYYNNVSMTDKSLIEYFKAKKLLQQMGDNINLSKIEKRIKDMKLRINEEEFKVIERKYG